MDKVEKFPLLFHSVIIIIVSTSQSTYSCNLFFSFFFFLLIPGLLSFSRVDHSY